jgi:hypothetical protein
MLTRGGALPQWRWSPGVIVWIAPCLVALGLYRLSDHRITDVIGGGVVVLLFIWAVRHPGPSLSIMAVLVAVQGVGFGFLYAAHIPSGILRAGGGLKDMFGIAILVSALGAMTRRGRRLGRLDQVALVYVLAVTLYLLLPGLFAPGSPKWSDRLLSWRLDAGYALVFIALRHAPISARARAWFAGTVLAIGAVASGFAVWQYVSPSGFYRFIVNTGKQVAYQRNVLHSSGATIQSTLQYLTANGSHLHLGSIFLSPFDMADYLLIVVAVIVERLARGGRNLGLVVLLGAVVFALFASQVRADAVAALVVFLVALMPARGRPELARWRLALAIAIGAAIVVPYLGGTRFTGGHNGGVSTSGHVREFNSGFNELLRRPLGLGLGDNPVTANRFILPGSGALTSDNSYLQVGDELGVLALIPWLLFVFGALVALRRRARAPSAMAASAGLALGGLMVTGLFHHVFLNFSTPWTLWAMIGLGLSRAEERPDSAPARAPRAAALPAAV